mgnify:CR=1 FL=1
MHYFFCQCSSSTAVPADVPAAYRALFRKNYQTITHNSSRILLLSGDQKLEHLNTDFYGPGVDGDHSDTHHLFTIAAAGHIGAFVTHVGLIAHYARQYPTIPYIAKLSGKTNIIKPDTADPYAEQLWSVDDALNIAKNSNITLCGVAITVYLGSLQESRMLKNAAQMITNAHRNGLVALVWMYPRGINIPNPRIPELTIGSAAAAVCIGADIVKINPPEIITEHEYFSTLKRAVQAAAPCKVILAGGPRTAPHAYLRTVHRAIHEGNVAGIAVARNVHQLELSAAIEMSRNLENIIYKNGSIS